MVSGEATEGVGHDHGLRLGNEMMGWATVEWVARSGGNVAVANVAGAPRVSEHGERAGEALAVARGVLIWGAFKVKEDPGLEARTSVFDAVEDEIRAREPA